MLIVGRLFIYSYYAHTAIRGHQVPGSIREKEWENTGKRGDQVSFQTMSPTLAANNKISTIQSISLVQKLRLRISFVFLLALASSALMSLFCVEGEVPCRCYLQWCPAAGTAHFGCCFESPVPTELPAWCRLTAGSARAGLRWAMRAAWWMFVWPFVVIYQCSHR